VSHSVTYPMRAAMPPAGRGFSQPRTSPTGLTAFGCEAGRNAHGSALILDLRYITRSVGFDGNLETPPDRDCFATTNARLSTTTSSSWQHQRRAHCKRWARAACVIDGINSVCSPKKEDFDLDRLMSITSPTSLDLMASTAAWYRLFDFS